MVNVQSGEVVITTTVEKTIISAETGGDIFKYFDADTMLVEIEAGVTRNEPVTYAVRKAIEKGVVDMINKGAKKNLWEFDVPVVEAPERKLPMLDTGNGDELNSIKVHPSANINIEIGEEKVEKTYEMYLEEKKLKKELETEQTETEEQDEEINNDSSDSGNANPNQ